MYKMLIVEDERWEREGLVDFLDWESMGISTVETASDGIEGLERAFSIKPDIVITDIQMPGRNGIEMAKLILERLPEVRIVVLTGYDDFEYAREALRFGAVDYVLKPVEEEEMLGTMLKVVQGCEEKAAVRHVSLRQSCMDLLLNRIEHETKMDTISELLQNGYLEANAFSVWVFSLSIISPPFDTSQLEQAAVKALQRRVLVHSVGEGGRSKFAVLIPLQKEEVGQQKQIAGELLKELETLVVRGNTIQQEQSEFVRWTFGIGSPKDRIDLISESFRESLNTLNYAVFNDLFGLTEAVDEHLARKQFTLRSEEFTHHFREITKRIKHDLGSGNQTELVLDELFNFLAVHPGAGKSYIAALLGGLIESFSSLAMPTGKAATSVATGHMEALLACERLQEMRDYVAASLEEIERLLEEKRNHKDDFLISRVIQLIEEHYGNQDLSLAYLAGEVFVSPNHLGMIFKKITGKTPSEYIQEFRLERAEELLRTTKQRVALVAEQIGIPNASYFGLLYKQVYGMTPGEYREFVQR
ncbi:MAG: response regulator [Paenibacillus sp.]|nr:response regulator [Paenibacillus sp.]